MNQFCSICKAQNKSVSEYTSHNVIGRGGVILCNTLLGLTCGYCKEKGHTPKYCPVAKRNNKEREMREKERNKPVAKPVKVKKTKKATLWVDDGEEEEPVEEKPVEEKPVEEKPVIWHSLTKFDPEDPFKPQVWPKRAKPVVVDELDQPIEPIAPLAKVNWDEDEE